MPTGPRGSAPVSPRDLTGRKARELLREKQTRERAEDNPLDVEAIERAAFQRGVAAATDRAFDAGVEWAFGILRDAGIDVDAVLALDDDEDDDAGEDA